MENNIDPRCKDLTGKKFGKLVVTGLAARTPGQGAYFVCKCSCGGVTTARGSSLRIGDTRSCGCIKGKKKKNSSRNKNQMENIWLSNEIRKYIKKNDMSMRQLAADANIHGGRACISWLLSGKRGVSFFVGIRLATAAGIKLSTLQKIIKDAE